MQEYTNNKWSKQVGRKVLSSANYRLPGGYGSPYNTWFLHGSLLWQTDRPIDRQTTLRGW